MDEELQFLVHFFNNRAHLFKTITMAGAAQADEICDEISSQKGWYWGRYAQSERLYYLERRLFVENELYEGYTRAYGCLKEKKPVYFYLYPGITKQQVIERGRQRGLQDGKEPHILMVKVEDIQDSTNMTFTLNDSFTAYRKKAIEAGIVCRGDGKEPVVLEDHNKIFPFAMIEQIHRKYKAQPITYEIQVWDYQLLEQWNFSIVQ